MCSLPIAQRLLLKPLQAETIFLTSYRDDYRLPTNTKFKLNSNSAPQQKYAKIPSAMELGTAFGGAVFLAPKNIMQKHRIKVSKLGVCPRSEG